MIVAFGASLLRVLFSFESTSGLVGCEALLLLLLPLLLLLLLLLTLLTFLTLLLLTDGCFFKRNAGLK